MKRIIIALAALIVTVAAILVATVQADENETSTPPLIETPTAINETSTPPLIETPTDTAQRLTDIESRLAALEARVSALESGEPPPSPTPSPSPTPPAATATPVPPGQPDLIVDALHASARVLTAGQSFTLRATVRNKGDAESDSTTLRYYRSNDSTISSDDTEVGTDDIARIPAAVGSILRFNNEFIQLDAPSTPGVHRYGACVDAVANESDTTNNCSSSVTIRVRATPTPVPTSEQSRERRISTVAVKTIAD